MPKDKNWHGVLDDLYAASKPPTQETDTSNLHNTATQEARTTHKHNKPTQQSYTTLCSVRVMRKKNAYARAKAAQTIY